MYRMWTHGNNLQVEYPDRIRSLRRAGYHAQVFQAAGTDNWFHFPVPTPAVVAAGSTRADAIILRFRTPPGEPNVSATFIETVHVFDGRDSPIATHDGLELRSNDWRDQRFDIPNNPTVRGGIGISVRVSFRLDGNFRIDFAAAGCEFQHP
jgi:hypothetical protein